MIIEIKKQVNGHGIPSKGRAFVVTLSRSPSRWI